MFGVHINSQDPKWQWPRRWKAWTPIHLRPAKRCVKWNDMKEALWFKSVVQTDYFLASKPKRQPSYHDPNNIRLMEEAMYLEGPLPSLWRAVPGPTLKNKRGNETSFKCIKVEKLKELVNIMDQQDHAWIRPNQSNRHWLACKAVCEFKWNFSHLTWILAPRNRMLSCSMVSHILFMASSLRDPPMRRFFWTWSPKWKTAEAILGVSARGDFWCTTHPQSSLAKAKFRRQTTENMYQKYQI